MTERPYNTDTMNKKIILVAEDDDISFALIQILLAGRYDLMLRARNGEEAVRFYEKNPDVNLILMDLKMPVMDGYEATRQIRSRDKNIPIIAQTAYALAGDDRKAIEAGCNDYIAKPIKKDALIEKVETYLQKIHKS